MTRRSHGRPPDTRPAGAVTRHRRASGPPSPPLRVQLCLLVAATCLTTALAVTLTASGYAAAAAAALVTLAGLTAAARVSRTVTTPVSRLRQAVQRQRDGDTIVRADDGHGPAEVRELAAALNALTARRREQDARQAVARELQQVTSGIGRAIRATATVREAAEVACTQLGPALRARRAVATLTGQGPAPAMAQWHVPALPDLPGVGDELDSQLRRLAGDLWSSGGELMIGDLRATDIQRQPWARLLRWETGATSLLLVPVGLGRRLIGAIWVLSDLGRRDWTEPEAATTQQVAAFLARAVTQSEHETQQSGYITRLEDLDRQKTEFLSTVSHELRTPLTSIQGYLELLRDGEAGTVPDSQLEMLGVIERNTSRLRGLIEDLLILSRVESRGLALDTRDVSLRELTGNTAGELRPLADKKAVRLHVSTGSDPATIAADPAQLGRALVNVLSNAIKFTPRDGAVRLSCHLDPAAGEAVITCQDTGIGIPQADQEHLFTRFYRASNATSNAIPGTGLGLSIVAAITDAHHGHLILNSAEGKGTTVTIRLPLTTPARTAAASGQ
jgi:two-component system, OmpR family, phosphate regulon sensor histidine kinase PhoR